MWRTSAVALAVGWAEIAGGAEVAAGTKSAPIVDSPSLSVSIDDIEALAKAIPRLRKVRELHIDATCKRTMKFAEPLPANLGDLADLELLELGSFGRQDCDFRVTLPASMARLKKLKSLSIDDAYERSFVLPAFLGELTALEELRLGRLELTEVPPFVRSLKRLKRLDLWRNPIREVPAFLAELPELESIELSYTGVRSLPDALAKSRSLRSVEMGNCGLRRAEQEALSRAFPGVKFDFSNEYDDANEDVEGK